MWTSNRQIIIKLNTIENKTSVAATVPMVTCTDKLSNVDISLWREQENDVIERNWADEIQHKPTLQVVYSDLTRWKNYLVTDFVRDNSCCLHIKNYNDDAAPEMDMGPKLLDPIWPNPLYQWPKPTLSNTWLKNIDQTWPNITLVSVSQIYTCF